MYNFHRICWLWLVEVGVNKKEQEAQGDGIKKDEIAPEVIKTEMKYDLESAGYRETVAEGDPQKINLMMDQAIYHSA